MLHVDVPTRTDLSDLASHRGEMSVSLFLPMKSDGTERDAERTQYRNLAREAITKLDSATSADKRRVRELEEEFEDLLDDDLFWRYQANGLAVFATPENVRTFRVPSRFEPAAHVSDRFHVKPLFRATSFGNAAYVLALSENAVRVVEVSPDLPPATVRVPELPESAADAVGKSSLGDRGHSGRIVGSEGKNVRFRQYARAVDSALRGLMSGSDIPLILATTNRLDSIYRSVNTYPGLVTSRIDGSPDRVSDTDLAQAARPILDGLAKERLAAWHDRFRTFDPQGRAASDVAVVARAATMGAVQSLLVDMDGVVPGTVDDATGAVQFADSAGAGFGIVDEIARRTLLTGGEVFAVRAADMPRDTPVAAILRHRL